MFEYLINLAAVNPVLAIAAAVVAAFVLANPLSKLI